MFFDRFGGPGLADRCFRDRFVADLALLAPPPRSASTLGSSFWPTWLGPAVRNALLVYRPNPETQKLEELLTQPWAQKLQLCIGTKRYSPNYLQDRLKWLDSEGVPKEADWSLSETAKAMSDLQVWDYYHKEDSTQETEEPTELDLDGALTGDLEVALENSLSLRVAPALKRAAWRRMGTWHFVF